MRINSEASTTRYTQDPARRILPGCPPRSPSSIRRTSARLPDMMCTRSAQWRGLVPVSSSMLVYHSACMLVVVCLFQNASFPSYSPSAPDIRGVALSTPRPVHQPPERRQHEERPHGAWIARSTRTNAGAGSERVRLTYGVSPYYNHAQAVHMPAAPIVYDRTLGATSPPRVGQRRRSRHPAKVVGACQRANDRSL